MQSYFFIRHKNQFEKIEYRDIILVEALKNYCRIVTTKKVYMPLITMKKFESVMPDSFCRIHRSYIVSLDYVVAFDTHSVFLPDRQLPIGDQYRPVLERRVTIIQRDQPVVPDFEDFLILETTA